MCYMTPLQLWMWCELLTRMINIGEQVAEIYTNMHFVVTNKSSLHAMAITCTQFLSMSTKQQYSEYQRHPHPIKRQESQKVAIFFIKHTANNKMFHCLQTSLDIGNIWPCIWWSRSLTRLQPHSAHTSTPILFDPLPCWWCSKCYNCRKSMYAPLNS